MGDKRVFDRIITLAWTQHGAFSVAQALGSGVSRSWIDRHHARGHIVRRHRGVYVVAGSPDTARQRLMVDVLAAGDRAHATGESALAVWCDEIQFPDRSVIAAPVGCGRRVRGARIIRSSDLSLAKAGVVDGIPVVGVARALLDASIDRSADAIAALTNACQRQRPVAIGALIECLHLHERPGRPGIKTFRAAIRALTEEVPDSEFERLVLRDLGALGVEPPRLHHLVRLHGEKPIELDLDWPGLCLDVELDGRDHTTRMNTARRDRQRDRLLQAAGFVVARYVWEDYLSERTAMLTEIADFVDRRKSARGVAR